jgi:hypothetical protein
MFHEIMRPPTPCEVFCPLDGKPFDCGGLRGGFQYGYYLNLKPCGALLAPTPYPRCPRDHFIVYKDIKQFSPDEIASLKQYVESAEYLGFVKDEHENYYLLGKILEHEKRAGVEELAYTYLQATWEAENSLWPRDQEGGVSQIDTLTPKYILYANESLKFYKQLITICAPTSKKSITAHLLIGELLRRLREFDSAEQHFHSLLKIPVYQENIFRRNVIHYQLSLIAQRDSELHEVPEAIFEKAPEEEEEYSAEESGEKPWERSYPELYPR